MSECIFHNNGKQSILNAAFKRNIFFRYFSYNTFLDHFQQCDDNNALACKVCTFFTYIFFNYFFFSAQICTLAVFVRFLGYTLTLNSNWQLVCDMAYIEIAIIRVVILE